MKKFSWIAALSYAYNTTISNFPFLIGFMIIVGFVGYFPSYIRLDQKYSFFGSTYVFEILPLLVGQYLQMSLLRISLEYTRNENPNFSVLIKNPLTFIPYLIGTILYVLIVISIPALLFGIAYLFKIFGLIDPLNNEQTLVITQLIILISLYPVTYFTIKYGFFGYFIIDRNIGIVDSFAKSAFATNRIKIKLFIFFIILLALNGLGIFICFVSFGVIAETFIGTEVGKIAYMLGLVVTLPITYLAIAYVFRILTVQRTVKRTVRRGRNK